MQPDSSELIHLSVEEQCDSVMAVIGQDNEPLRSSRASFLAHHFP